MTRHRDSADLPPEVLFLAIEEIRRTNDWLTHAYDTVKSRSLTLIGGALGLLVFLYASNGIFFPKEVYGQILYIIGLGLMIFALGLLFLATVGRHWEFSLESRDLEKMDFKDYDHFLAYVKERSLYAYRCNKSAYDKAQMLSAMALKPLLAGAIILIVMKIFAKNLGI